MKLDGSGKTDDMKNKQIIFLFVIIFFSSCYFLKYNTEELKNQIGVVNETDISIYFCATENIKNVNPYRLYNKKNFYYIPSKEDRLAGYVPFCLESIWENEKIDTLMLFFFSENILINYSWDTIIKNEMESARLYYTYDELMDCGCTIVVDSVMLGLKE